MDNQELVLLTPTPQPAQPASNKIGDSNILKLIIIGYIALSPIIFAFYKMNRFEDAATLLSALSSFILSLLMMDKFRPFINRIFREERKEGEEKKIELAEIIITFFLTLILFLSIDLIIAKEYPMILIVVLALIALIIYIFEADRKI